MVTRWLCKECGSILGAADLLRAPNPFDPDDTLSGCPDCKAVNEIVAACHEYDCPREASSGRAWDDGVYRWSCHEHDAGTVDTSKARRVPL